MKNRTPFHASMLALCLAVACARGDKQNASDTNSLHIVSGTVSLPAGSVLPSDALVNVQVSDISRQDVAASVVAETTFAAVGRTPPFVFTLPYSPAHIDERNTYAVRATLRGDSRLLYTTTQLNPVITRGNPTHVDLEFVAASSPMEAPVPAAAPPLPGGIEARGNEPFWSVRVDEGTAVVKTPEELEGVEYMSGSWAQPDVARWIFSARREAGGILEKLTLEIIKQPCVDSMSGAEYPFRAVLTRDGRRMEGCGMQPRN